MMTMGKWTTVILAGLVCGFTAAPSLATAGFAQESGHGGGKSSANAGHGGKESETESCGGGGGCTHESGGEETASHESDSEGHKGGNNDKGRRGAPDAVHGASHSGIIGHIFEQDEPKNDETTSSGDRGASGQ